MGNNRVMDAGGDREYVTSIMTPDGQWHAGPRVKASSYREAEKWAIQDFVYRYGYHQNTLHARAKRFDAKSVWRKNEKGMSR